MGYTELISEMIQQSGISLKQIASRCKERGQRVDASYLSKLQTGKQVSSSEELNRAIAESCGGNADLLIWEGYMAKAPEIVREYVNVTLPGIKDSMKMMFPAMFPPEQAEILIGYIDNMSPIELIKMINEQHEEFSVGINEDYNLTEIDSEQVNIELGQTIGIPMMDDSMEPTIPYRANVKYSSLDISLIIILWLLLK